MSYNMTTPQTIIHRRVDAYYPPLGDNEIRILRLNPTPGVKCANTTADHDHQRLPCELSFIRCSLAEAALLSFVALSYAWGHETSTISLSISDGEVKINPNLFAILQNFCERGSLQLVWIDAICINQGDTPEKSSQIKLMRDIYSCADHVDVFLSRESALYDLGISYFERAASNKEEHFEPGMSPILTIDGLNISSDRLRDSMIAFFAVSWWTRTWTVQEFVLARKISFICGKRILDGQTLREAFFSFRHHERSCCWTSATTLTGYSRGWIDMPSAANHGLSVWEGMLRLDQLHLAAGIGYVFRSSVLSTLSALRTRSCTDPRDRIYGILGMRVEDEQTRNAITINYDMSTVQVYQSVAAVLSSNSSNLDVLSHVLPPTVAKPGVTGLPTWVPDWNAAMDDQTHLMYRERMNLMRLKSTTGDSKPICVVTDDFHLRTKAKLIGKISDHGPGYPTPRSKFAKQVMATWIAFSGMKTFDATGYEVSGNGHVSKSFGSLLCGNLVRSEWRRDKDGVDSANEFRDWCHWFVSDESAIFPQDLRHDIREYDNLVQMNSLGRRIFKTDSGRLGFGPESLEKGDEVVIIPGGRVPYVLRRYSSELCSTFEFLGEAFALWITEGQLEFEEEELVDIEIV